MCGDDAALTGIFTSQSAQSAIRNPPQYAIRHAEHAKSLQAFKPGTARAQEKSSKLASEAPA
eukprot:11390343-Alexandrium_andersonii.AAC.1